VSESAIEWTEVTWNPVTGCDRVAAGCDNCYALTLAKGLKAMGAEKYQSDGDPRTSGPGFAVTTHPSVLDQPYRWTGSRLVFVNSMSDLSRGRLSLSPKSTPPNPGWQQRCRGSEMRSLAHSSMGMTWDCVTCYRPRKRQRVRRDFVDAPKLPPQIADGLAANDFTHRWPRRQVSWADTAVR